MHLCAVQLHRCLHLKERMEAPHQYQTHSIRILALRYVPSISRHRRTNLQRFQSQRSLYATSSSHARRSTCHPVEGCASDTRLRTTSSIHAAAILDRRSDPRDSEALLPPATIPTTSVQLRVMSAYFQRS